MSLGKLPGFKGLVSGPQEKRRFKSDLSVDMISPPLGDFRHTMHVGRGGDVFGDTSFLSNYGGAREPGSPDSANSSKSTGFFTRTFRHIRKNSVARPRSGSRDLSSPPPDISPIIKNAISLPQLNIDSPNGCLQRSLFPSSTDHSICTYGLHSGFVTLPRLSRLDRQFQDADGRKAPLLDATGASLTRSDSLTSFTVDLGPSLMAEVLSVIDDPGRLRGSDGVQPAGEEEEDEGSLTETPVQSPGPASPGPWRDGGSPGGLEDGRCSDWTGPEEQRGSRGNPGDSAGPPWRAEPVMESERFQRAADVLSRHYGGGSFTRRSSGAVSPSSCGRKSPSGFSEEEEEEIKV